MWGGWRDGRCWRRCEPCQRFRLSARAIRGEAAGREAVKAVMSMNYTKQAPHTTATQKKDMGIGRLDDPLDRVARATHAARADK